MKLKFCLLILLLISSCASNDYLANMQFQKQYNSSLEGMRAKRQLANLAFENSQPGSLPPGVISAPGQTASPAAPLPNATPAAQLPEDMFDIKYDIVPYPPFTNIGGDFDAIKIPAADSYNVKTEVSDKPYLLVDAASIQGSVNKIKSERTAQDVANSEVLIAEIKKITREERMIHPAENKEAKDKKAKKTKAKKNNSDEEVIVYDNPNKGKKDNSSAKTTKK